ncbi:hypothetical protein ACEQ8H_000900 [Pleosporales sp. CAS-2024a]
MIRDPTQWRRYASASTKSVSSRAETKPPPPPPPAKTAKTSTTATTRITCPPAKVSGATQVPASKAKEKLNPPDFTYAPELDVPPRGAQQSFVSYLWKSGRRYLSFYKQGVKNVRQTARLARALRAKAGPTGTVDYAAELTRAEWQIVRRSRKDMLRLPAFGLIFLVCGEWTPLLVRWITPLIPEPCRIPSQVERDLAKLENTRRARENMSARRVTRLIKRDPPKPQPVSGPPLPKGLNQVGKAKVWSGTEALAHTKLGTWSHMELYLMSVEFSLHEKAWDWIAMTPPKWLLRRRIARRVEYLKKDDDLIRRDGGWAALSLREVQMACKERGRYILGKKEAQVRDELAIWFGEKDEDDEAAKKRLVARR